MTSVTIAIREQDGEEFDARDFQRFTHSATIHEKYVITGAALLLPC